MPSKSRAEHAFMAMSKTPEGRRQLEAHGKKPAPMSVANEFLKADKGKHFKKKHIAKKVQPGKGTGGYGGY